MKNRITCVILILFLVLGNKHLKAQISPGYPGLDIKNISIKAPSGTVVPMGSTTQLFKQVFGQPDSTKMEYWEMDEKTAVIYYYSGSEFGFKDNKLVMYELINNYFFVGNSLSHTFVGANISVMPACFPHPSKTQQSGSLVATINDNNFVSNDLYIVFEYDNNSVITKIRVRML